MAAACSSGGRRWPLSVQIGALLLVLAAVVMIVEFRATNSSFAQETLMRKWEDFRIARVPHHVAPGLFNDNRNNYNAPLGTSTLGASTERTFFEENTGKKATENWNAYIEAREQCLKSASMSTHDIIPGRAQSDKDGKVVYFVTDGARERLAVQPSNLSVQRCSVKMPSGSEWRIVRAGPFTSSGDFTWHTFKVTDPFDLEKDFGRDAAKSLLVRSRLASPVDTATGEALPYPPIHIHHWHLTPRWAGGQNTVMHTVWAQAHGDSQCDRSEGFTNCLLQTQPNGFALELLDSLDMDADLVDARRAGSGKIQFYAEAAIEILPVDEDSLKRKPVQLLSIGNPFRFNESLASMLVQGAQLYFFPTDIGSTVMWFSSRFIASGEYLWTYMHTHQSYVHTVLVFAAPPEELGLNSGKWILRRPWDPLSISSLGFNSADDVVGHLRRQPGGSALKCVYRNHIDGPDQVGRRLVGCSSPNPDGPSSLPWRFKRGDVITIVALSASAKTTKDETWANPVSSAEFAQHTIFRGLVNYDRNDALFTSKKKYFQGLYVFGTPDPDYQLEHNAFPDFRALLEAGGSPVSGSVSEASIKSSPYAICLRNMASTKGGYDFSSLKTETTSTGCRRSEGFRGG